MCAVWSSGGFAVASWSAAVNVRWSTGDLVSQETIHSVCARLRTRQLLSLHVRAIQRRMYCTVYRIVIISSNILVLM